MIIVMTKLMCTPHKKRCLLILYGATDERDASEVSQAMPFTSGIWYLEALKPSCGHDLLSGKDSLEKKRLCHTAVKPH